MNGRNLYRVMVYLSVFQIQISSEQMFPVKPLITEVLGRATQYYPDESVSSIPTKTNCSHPVLIPHPKWRDMRQIVTCFLEVFQRGGIRRRQDFGMRANELIRSHGYTLVTYNNVTSKDGYIQTVFRITGSKKSPPRKGKQAVLMFHAAFSSSDQFFLLGENSLPFVLANSDYDVWLINARGTDYSIKHTYYDAVWDKDYWDFSFHEMAVIDLPLYVDLILSETGQEKVFFVGHSLGCQVYVAAMAANPDLNKKIHAAFLLGAPLSTKYSTSLLRLLSVFMELPPRVQRFLYDDVMRGQLSIGNWFVNQVYSGFCSMTATTCGLCGAVYTLAGFGNGNLEYTKIPNIVSRVMNSVSIKFWLHTGQNYRNCKFQQFDYGAAKNLKIYGNEEPPLYNLQNIRSPIHIYYSDSDVEANPKDLSFFARTLPPGTLKALNRINASDFNHFDFISSNSAPRLVYSNVIKEMKMYKTL